MAEHLRAHFVVCKHLNFWGTKVGVLFSDVGRTISKVGEELGGQVSSSHFYLAQVALLGACPPLDDTHLFTNCFSVSSLEFPDTPASCVGKAGLNHAIFHPDLRPD